MKPGTKKTIPRVFVEYIDFLTFSLSIEILLILSFHNNARRQSLIHCCTMTHGFSYEKNMVQKSPVLIKRPSEETEKPVFSLLDLCVESNC